MDFFGYDSDTYQFNWEKMDDDIAETKKNRLINLPKFINIVITNKVIATEFRRYFKTKIANNPENDNIYFAFIEERVTWEEIINDKYTPEPQTEDEPITDEELSVDTVKPNKNVEDTKDDSLDETDEFQEPSEVTVDGEQVDNGEESEEESEKDPEGASEAETPNDNKKDLLSTIYWKKEYNVVHVDKNNDWPVTESFETNEIYLYKQNMIYSQICRKKDFFKIRVLLSIYAAYRRTTDRTSFLQAMIQEFIMIWRR